MQYLHCKKYLVTWNDKYAYICIYTYCIADVCSKHHIKTDTSRNSEVPAATLFILSKLLLYIVYDFQSVTVHLKKNIFVLNRFSRPMQCENKLIINELF